MPAAVATSAESNALALTQGIKRQSHMFPHHVPFGRFHRPRMRRQVAVEKGAEGALTNETDAGRVFLAGIVQADRGGDAAYLGLGQFAHRKQGARELGLVESMQKVALVFRGVKATQQLEAVHSLADAGVVAGGDVLRAKPHRVIQEGLELDLGVAEDIGVGGTPGGVFAKKFGEYAILVFGGEIHRLDVDSDQVGDADGVKPVLTRRAIL